MKFKHFIWLLVGIAILAIALWVVKPAGAIGGGHQEVCICHNVQHNPHTVCADMSSIQRGHGNHLESGFDSWGRCPEVTPTLTPTPRCCKPTPTPTCKPTATPTQELTPTPTKEPEKPSPTPTEKPVEPTLTPTPKPTDPPIPSEGCGAECAGPASPPICIAEPLREAPVVTKAWRDGNGNLDVEWVDVENWGYVLYYTTTGQQDWLWNVIGVNTPYQVHEVWQMVDVKVCALNPCGEEKCSERFIDP